METTIRLSRQKAAEWLARRLQHKTPEQWELWLRNNANNARRAAYRVPVEPLGRHAYYRLDELEKFATFEQGRQRGTLKLTGRAAEVLEAFGLGTNGATTKGRRWKGATANPSPDGDTAFVQTIINEPLLVFAMTPEQAIEFGQELLDAGQAAKRINEER